MPTSFKMVGFGLLLTLIGIFMVQKDLRLRFWGKTVDADVMEVWERTGRRGSSTLQMDILFRDDEGNSVKGSCALASGIVPGAKNQKVQIVYLPGNSGVHRLASESSGFAYLIFLAGLGLTAFGAWYFFRESVTEAHRETAEDIEEWKKPPNPKDIAKKIIRRM